MNLINELPKKKKNNGDIMKPLVDDKNTNIDNPTIIEIIKGGYVDVRTYNTALDYFNIRKRLFKALN